MQGARLLGPRRGTDTQAMERPWRTPSASGSSGSAGSRTGCARPATGTCGARTSASASGARSGRTTAPTARRGTTCPHDHARSRAYRWGEDGLAGFCDIEQRLCLGLALWNGRDPILKERMFGLTGAQANHGEDVKEYWWYLDALPSHAWNRWRYHYPQAAFPYDDLIAENGRRGQARPRVRAARHRRVRRRPLLDRRGRLRQGRPHRPAHDGPGHQRRPGRRPRCTCCPRPGSATPGRGSVDAPRPRSCVPRRRRRRRPSTIRSSATLELLAGAGAGRRRPDRCCSARTRPTTQRLFGVAGRRRRTPRTASTTTSCTGAPTVNPDRQRHQGGVVVPARRSRRRQRSSCGCGCARPAPSRRPRRRSAPTSTGSWPSAGRGRRVLRRADAAGPPGRRGDGDAPGLRRDAVEQAALLLRRGPLARRRPDPAGAAAARRRRPQRPLAQLRRLRHHVDAGQVGVPVVRGVGPGLPLRRPGPRRPGVRQVPAAAAVPRVVPAPQRRAARLRVGLRRRQPAGAGVGRARGVRHRRRPRPRLPQPGVRQAAGRTSPGG